MKTASMLALLAMLGLALASELIGWAEPDAPVQVMPPRPSPPGAAAAPSADPARRGQWVATMLARPLFAANRRPRAPLASESAPPPPPALPRVAGTMITAEGKRVIFAGVGEGRPTVVGEGGELNGFRVQSIEPGRVTVIGPGGSRTLLTSFDPNRPALSAPPPGLSGLTPANPAIPPVTPSSVFPPPMDLSGALQSPGPPPGRPAPR